MVPKWVVTTPLAHLSSTVAILGALAAVTTTLIEWSLVWALATAGEVVLGLILSGLMPVGLRFLAVLLTIPITVAILGSLWGFWYL